MLSYLFHVQRLIVFATMVLHNFVRMQDKVDEEFNIYIHNSIQMTYTWWIECFKQ